MFRYKPKSSGNRSEVIVFNLSKNAEEFKSFKIISISVGVLQSTLENILKLYWDCFVKVGIKRVIFEFSFTIDTGDATPVYCNKVHDEPHESKIIMK